MANNIEVTVGSGTTLKTTDNASVHTPHHNVDVIAAGDNNIGNVDVASIAAGDNNIGNVDVVTLPALPAGTNNIGDVDVLSLPALPAGTNAIGKLAANSGVDIGDVDVTSVVPGTGATSLGKAADGAAGATDTGVAALQVRDDALATLTPIDGDYNPLRGNARGAQWVAIEDGAGGQITTFGGGAQYTEADVDATITGTAVMWEDASDTLRAVSAAKPLPVNVVAGSAAGTEYTEADIDASIAGTAIMWEDTSDTLRAVSAAKPLPTQVSAALPAGTNNIGDVDIASIAAGTNNIGDVDILSIAAGENVIGKAAVPGALIDVTLSLDTAAYADGDVLADTQTVTSMFRVADGTATLDSIHVLDEDDQGQALDLIFLGANNSIGTENAAVSVTDANARDIQGRVRIGAADYYDMGGCRIATISGIGLKLKAASGVTTGNIAAVSRGTGTYTASGIRLKLGLTWD